MSLKFDPSTIAYLSADYHYTWIHYLNGNRYYSSYQIKRLSNQLPGFIRIHKHYLVNPEIIERVDLKSGPRTFFVITMKSGQMLSAGKKRTAQLKKIFKQLNIN